MSKVFISYSHADSHLASVINQVLLQANYEVEFDRAITPGTHWRDWLRDHIQSAAVVVVLWSRSAVDADWVRAEAELARKNSVLLPLIVDDLSETDIPFGFSERQWLRCDWEHRSDDEVKLTSDTERALLSALEVHLGTVTPLRGALAEIQRNFEELISHQYEDVELVGTGRLAVVFRARHKEVGEWVAFRAAPLAGIWLLPNYVEQFQRGISFAQRLKHPHILDIREWYIGKSLAYTAMQYVDGYPLARLTERGPLALGRAKQIALHIAEALAFAHSNDIIHCNLSPHCVLVDKEDKPYITDFGLAYCSRLQSGGTTTAALFPNPRYLSPEQCLGQPITPRSDQYLLGLLLYELLTGRHPFDGSIYMLMKQHCETLPPPILQLRPELPHKVAATVGRLLEKDPRRRFLVTKEVVETIAQWPSYESRQFKAIPPSKEDERDAVILVKHALDRLNPTSLYIEFYQRLQEDHAIAPHFTRVNFDRQVTMIGAAVSTLLDYALQPTEHDAQVQKYAATHRAMHISRTVLNSFADTLLAVIIKQDPSGDEPEALRRAWKAAMVPGLQRFAELACAPDALFAQAPASNLGEPGAGMSPSVPAGATFSEPPDPQRVSEAREIGGYRRAAHSTQLFAAVEPALSYGVSNSDASKEHAELEVPPTKRGSK